MGASEVFGGGVAVITGAGAGIGAGLARHAHTLGMTVVPLGPGAGTAVLKALRNNEVVCLLCDRDIGGGTGIGLGIARVFAERGELVGSHFQWRYRRIVWVFNTKRPASEALDKTVASIVIDEVVYYLSASHRQ